jgi:TctA family transporter
MIEAFIQGLMNFTNPAVFAALFGATIIGIILGVLPGVTGGLGMIILLPFIIGLDPMLVLPVIIAFATTAGSGGSVLAILLGIPGEPSNAACVLDGFPMTKKGQGLRAVGASITTCWMSNIASVVFAFAMIPIIVPVVMNFKSAEVFLMIAIALCFISSVTKESQLKGLISACLGLLLSTIGFQAKTGEARFSFGSLYLYDGLGLVVMILGVFALPALVEMIVQKEEEVSEETIAKTSGMRMREYGELLKGTKDVFQHWWLWLRAAVLGYIVGVIPGVGGEMAPWVGYANAKQGSKHPETFGTGNIEGVIGPESANNAKTGGDLLTTLAFGIPGSGKMVFVLAAFILVGIQPGPWVLTKYMPLSFTMLQTVAVTAIFSSIILYFTAPYMVRLVKFPVVYQFGFLVPLVFISVFVNDNVIEDIFLLFVASVAGYFVKKNGYFLSAMIMGFILGKLAEYYLWQSLDLSGPSFLFSSPICIVELLAIPLILFYEDIKTLINRWRTPKGPRLADGEPSKEKAS